MADEELIEALVNLGTTKQAAEAAVKRGAPETAVFEPILMRARLERTVTPAEVASRGGLDVDEIRTVMHAFGFPPPGADEPTFTPDEAHVFAELGRLRKIWPLELMVQLSRLYGRMLSRLADAELQSFIRYTVPALRDGRTSLVDELGATQSAFEALLPLADPLLVGVHRRWVEHELAQLAIREAETTAGARRLPGSVEVALLFCDLKDFTRYAEVKGDDAAIAVVDEFFDIVSRERGDGGRVVKSLGDGAMLAYDAAGEAVAAGARVIDAMRGRDVPGVHASVHQGLVIAREGDFFGGAVNLAARLLAFAGRDELAATEAVVGHASSAAFKWESIGECEVRGVAAPLSIYRLLQPVAG